MTLLKGLPFTLHLHKDRCVLIEGGRFPESERQIYLQLEVVMYLVENKADINLEDQFKNTSLNDAVRHK